MLQKIDEGQSAVKLFDPEKFKNALLVIPVLGTLCAVTFDVGYFSGIDINYYSVFSLAEHIGFALEVAPAAFLGTLLSLVTMVPLYSTLKKVRSTKLLVVVDIGWDVIGLGAWWISNFTAALSITFTVLLGLLLQKLTSALSKFQTKLYFVVSSIMTIFIFIFFLGYDMGHLYANGNIPRHLLNDDTAGRLIRSGERGVLFVTKGDKQIVLYRWDGIKSIKTINLSSEDRKQLLIDSIFGH